MKGSGAVGTQFFGGVRPQLSEKETFFQQNNNVIGGAVHIHNFISQFLYTYCILLEGMTLLITLGPKHLKVDFCINRKKNCHENVLSGFISFIV